MEKRTPPGDTLQSRGRLLVSGDSGQQVSKSSQPREPAPQAQETALELTFPAAARAAFRQRLPGDCREAFDTLTHEGCKAAQIVYYLTTLTLAYGHHKALETAPRMDRDKVRSLVRRTLTLSGLWDIILHSTFGEQVLSLALRSDPSGTEAEFRNIPQRLYSLAQCVKDAHSGTTHHRRPLYDDTLAELLVYVERATGKPHLNEVSLLLGHMTGRESYSFNDLSAWKTDHKPAIERAHLRLGCNS